jgi:hypothetical protein
MKRTAPHAKGVTPRISKFKGDGNILLWSPFVGGVVTLEYFFRKISRETKAK